MDDLKLENEKLKREIEELKSYKRYSEFEKATYPAIEYLQKHGGAMQRIIIEWDRAILESVEMSVGAVVPD